MVVWAEASASDYTLSHTGTVTASTLVKRDHVVAPVTSPVASLFSTLILNVQCDFFDIARVYGRKEMLP